MYDWGYVCDDGITQTTADVVCRIMGFAGGLDSFETQEEVPLLRYTMESLVCKEGDLLLDECSYRLTHDGNHHCGRKEAVKISCLEVSRAPTAPTTRAPIKASPTSTAPTTKTPTTGAPTGSPITKHPTVTRHFSLDENQLVKFGDGYVCDEGFDSVTADVVCKFLGFPEGSEDHKTGRYLSSGYTISLGSLWCESEAKTIEDCEVTEGDCHNGAGVKVWCKEPTNKPTTSEPTTTSSPTTVSPTTVAPTQRTGFTTDEDGILMYDWGYVCDDGITQTTADVVCRIMGFAGGLDSFETQEEVPLLRYTMESLVCKEGDLLLDECSYRLTHDGNHHCGRKEAVKISCLEVSRAPTAPTTRAPIKASPTSTAPTTKTPTTGAPTGSPITKHPTVTRHFSLDENQLVKFGDGYVCDEGFDSVTADVVCKFLGFPEGSEDHKTGRYLSSGYTISLGSLWCESEAKTIEDCEVTEGDCHNGAGVKVWCKEPTNKPTTSEPTNNEPTTNEPTTTSSPTTVAPTQRTAYTLREEGLRMGCEPLDSQRAHFFDGEHSADECYNKCKIWGKTCVEFFIGINDQKGCLVSDRYCRGNLVAGRNYNYYQVIDVPSLETATPTSNAPITIAPTTETPTSLAPTTAAPTSNAPTTVIPMTETPTSIAPTNAAPTSNAPTTVIPMTETPSSLAPTALSRESTARFSLDGNSLLKYGSGYVCDDRFSRNTARAVCSLMGFTGGLDNYRSRQRIPEDSVYVLNDLRCNSGSQTSSLNECTYTNEVDDCNSREALKVICKSSESNLPTTRSPTTAKPTSSPTSESPTIAKLFSLEGGTNGEGLLMYGNGYVCDDKFSSVTANSVCNILGFISGMETFKAGQNIPLAGKFTMDNLWCPTNVASSVSCDFNENSDCNVDEGVYLSCVLPTDAPTTAAPTTLDPTTALPTTAFPTTNNPTIAYACSTSDGAGCRTCADQTERVQHNHCKTCNEGYFLREDDCVRRMSLGCWTDNSDRVFKTRLANHLGRNKCQMECLNAGTQYIYMGYKYHHECWCGTADEDYRKLGPNDGCRNGKGGAWSFNVYQIKDVNEPKFAEGVVGGGSCPLGYEKIATMEECAAMLEDASTNYEKNFHWGEGYEAVCYYCGGCGGTVSFNNWHGNLAKFICKLKPKYVEGSRGADDCPFGYTRATFEQCKNVGGIQVSRSEPGGCFADDQHKFWNENLSNREIDSHSLKPICFRGVRRRLISKNLRGNVRRAKF